MSLYNFENWDLITKRFSHWWEGELLDRALIQVTAPKKDIPQTHKYNLWTLVHNLNNMDYVFDEYKKYQDQTYFGGEAFPNFWINFGPGVMSAYIGAIPRVAEDTIWFETPKKWETIFDEVKYNANSEWWNITKESTRMATERSNGDFFVSMTDLGGNLDILAALRGTEDLLFDLQDNDQNVIDILKKIDTLWIQYYTGLNNIIHKKIDGTTAWMGLWSPKNWYPLQCDFSAMISPVYFEKFVAPSLRTESKYLDHTIYHLDGPGEIPHLDIILDIPEINGIQWVPGDGNANSASAKWLPLYKKIQDKGKLLQLPEVNPKLIESLLSEISPKGVLINTECKTEEEARYLVDNLEKWSLNKSQIFIPDTEK